MTDIEVYVNQGNVLGYTSREVVSQNGTAALHIEYSNNITNGMMYTITTKPKLNSDKVDISF